MRKLFAGVIPFVIFLSFYFFLIYLYRSEKIIVPQVVGKNMLDLMNLDNIFSWKIFRVSYNKNFPHGYIVWQYPQAGVLFKASRSILLEINHNRILDENIKNTTLEKCILNLNENGINYILVPIALCGIGANTVIGGNYLESEGLFYVYYVDPTYGERYYIKNCLGLSCRSFTFLQKLGNNNVVCKNFTNKDIEDFHNEEIVNQFPHVGNILKKDQKIYFWHQNMHCNEMSNL